MTPEMAAARFGFGAHGGTWPDPARYRLAPGPVDDPYPRTTTADTLAGIGTLIAARRARNDKAAGADAAYKDAERKVQAYTVNAARIALARAVDAAAGGAGADFHERLVWFWVDHFTVAARRPRDRALPAAFVDDAIRPHVAGRFADMLRAATLHPAMLIFLDQTVSVGPNSRLGQRREAGLNENLARELLELHTLGVGSGYSQGDVRELAELLTGLAVDMQTGTIFDPRRAEPGAETVLGARYGGDPADIAHVEAILDALAADPRTARHLARKLAVHFVADDPDPALVARLESVWRDTGGDLAAVSNALAADPAAQAAPATKVRRPLELVVAGVRALGLTGADVMALRDRPLQQALLRPQSSMGQPWLSPAGPDGWPEAAEAWITPQRLAARVDWAMTVPPALLQRLPDPRDFVVTALGPRAPEAVVTAAARAEMRSEGVGLVLASPAFNRR